jgi:hypothetical protein
LVDALSYISQLTTSTYQQDYEDDEYDVLDVTIGF